MAEQLSIELTAKIDGLRESFSKATKDVTNFVVTADGQLLKFDKSISTLERQLRSFQEGLKKSVDPSRIATLNSAIDQTKIKLEQTNKAINGAGLGKLTTGSNQAAFALTNLGRVAQDAPFGFIGIQNNLNPLLESFQALRKETGSNVGAFKAMAGSLLGAGGIGLALSVVTSAITFYTMWQQKSNKATKDSTKSNDDYVSSLDQVTQAQVKGAQNAQQEITQLSTLYKITQNVSLSSKQRLDAVNDLQSKYPEYFKNLKDETILNGGAKDAYDRLTTSIIATSRARAAQDLITKNASRQLENEQKITDLEVKRLKDLATAEKNLATIRKGGTGQGAAGFASIAGKAEERANAILSQQNNLRTDSAILAEKNLKLTESITEQIQKGADLSGKFGDIPKETESKLKSFADIMKELQQALLINRNQFASTFDERNLKDIAAHQSAIDSLLNNGYKELSKEVLKLKKEQLDLFQLPDLKSISANTGIDLPRNIKGNKDGIAFAGGAADTDFFANFTNQERQVYEAQARIIQSQEKFNTQISELATSGLTSSLGGIGEAIGGALASGGNVLEAVGQSLLSSLGGILIELGKAAIAVGVGMLAIKAAFKNPVTAIAAGVALVALGSFINNKVSKITSGGSSAQTQQSSPIPQFASGVNNFSGGMALVGERGPELVNLPTGASVIPNGRSERIMRNNNTDVVLNGNFGISMETLYFSLKRTEKKLGRLS